ncbi:TniQ family protein (plasmid) [Bradyrhizobium barranii]|uniref:TniQ family protein n=1 Tax=Bradyrhizobium barranii TaxID=2992140 RepID=A0ABY3R1S4_9BRAD|nr:TniQ family protein [Bradyrhizobium japonicum]UFW92223.1 TniQ family protein [Bradyrhizobium japonicum]
MSSWLGRLAQLYDMPVDALLACCGLGRYNARELEWRLGAGEGALLASRTGMTGEGLRTLTFEEIAPPARLMIAERSRYVCPRCPAGLYRKATAFPWNFWCLEHGVRFGGKTGTGLDALLTQAQLTTLDPSARIGAMRLADWAHGKDERAPAVPALLDFLTTRHRRSSPPSLAEQPILSLAARRTNHNFLTQPIARQALLVVVPEYDRVAPVLAKPVRPEACFRSRRARCCRIMPWPLVWGGCPRIPPAAPLRCCWPVIGKGKSDCGKPCWCGRRRCGGALMPGSGGSVPPGTPPPRSLRPLGRAGKHPPVSQIPIQPVSQSRSGNLIMMREISAQAPESHEFRASDTVERRLRRGTIVTRRRARRRCGALRSGILEGSGGAFGHVPHNEEND